MTRSRAEQRPLDITAMRAETEQLLGEDAQLPRYETVQHLAAVYRGHIMLLIPEIEELTGAFPKDDVRASVALAGVAEARRRLDEGEAVGLVGEVARTQRLARSVRALCDHHDSLSELTMCVVCDKPIREGEASEPYDVFSNSGGAKTGRVHPPCMPAHTRD